MNNYKQAIVDFVQVNKLQYKSSDQLVNCFASGMQRGLNSGVSKSKKHSCSYANFERKTLKEIIRPDQICGGYIAKPD